MNLLNKLHKQVIKILLMVLCGASMTYGNEKVRQCINYLSISVENTKEHKIKMEAWKNYEKEKERLKKAGEEINDNNIKKWKVFLEA